MRTRIIKMGRSRGILIPKRLIAQARQSDVVDVSVRGDTLVVGPASVPRAGWAEALAGMVPRADDRLVDDTAAPPTRWDGADWEW